MACDPQSGKAGSLVAALNRHDSIGLILICEHASNYSLLRTRGSERSARTANGFSSLSTVSSRESLISVCAAELRPRCFPCIRLRRAI